MIDMQNKKLIDGYPYIRHISEELAPADMIERSAGFYQLMDRRRSVRAFSPKSFPKAVLENILLAASTAPSGAHKQPWTFCIVSDPDTKRRIREAAEKEEKESYEHRMSEEWLEDLRPLGTDWQKPFLETAPYLVVVFSRSYECMPDGSKKQNYYVKDAGLAALTHTPSPMNFLARLLGRPENEKPFLLIPVGYVADDCWVPDLERKSLEQISVWYE